MPRSRPARAREHRWSNSTGIMPGSTPLKAVSNLVDQHAHKIRGLALRYCGNPSDADDIVQDTFLQAFRKWDQFRGEADPATWLYTIAVRACRKRHRRRSNEPRRIGSLEDLAPFGGTTVSRVGHEPSSLLESSIRREGSHALREAIARLPAPFRLAVVLRDMLELSTEQTAQVLCIKPQTVKTRVHRARLLLRDALTRHLPQRHAPAPLYDRRVCLDLLRAKLDAMDDARAFPVSDEVICDRCKGVFSELDLTRGTCAALIEGEIPDALRAKILALASDT